MTSDDWTNLPDWLPNPLRNSVSFHSLQILSRRNGSFNGGHPSSSTGQPMVLSGETSAVAVIPLGEKDGVRTCAPASAEVPADMDGGIV